VHFKLYPSSSGFLWGQTAVTDYDSGCLRSIVFKAHSPVKPDIEEKYKAVGALHEAKHAVSLYPNDQLWEVPFKDEVLPGVQLSGRCDFIVGDEIHETKGSLSKSAGYVLNGHYKVSHLAQLVTYMLRFDKPVGKIVFGAYKETKDGYTETGRREFRVLVSDTGRISVDGVDSHFTVQDLLSHRYWAAALIRDRRVHPVRPMNWDAKFGSPCSLCPFKGVCAKYDEGGMSDDEAIKQAGDVLACMKKSAS